MAAPRVKILPALPWLLASCAGPAATSVSRAAATLPAAQRPAAAAAPARAAPPPPRDDRALELGVGAGRVCAVLGDRSVRCRGGDLRAPSPLVTRAVPPARDLVLGGDRGCVHDDEGRTWCWGHAWWCGAGERLDPELPARVESLARGATVALPPERLNDSGAGLLARAEDGRVHGLWCGDDQPAEHTEFGGAVRQLSLGRSTACALLADGELRCREDLGPLQRVTGVAAPRAVVVGVGYACALGEGGRVGCWPVCEYREGDGGRGTSCGQWERRGRGRAREGAEAPPPDLDALPVAGVAGLTSLVVGDGYGCGLAGDGTVVCWTFPPPPRHRRRSRRAQLRTGAPFAVPGLTGVTRAVMEGETLCALRGDGTTWCAAPPSPAATAVRVRWESTVESGAPAAPGG